MLCDMESSMLILASFPLTMIMICIIGTILKYYPIKQDKFPTPYMMLNTNHLDEEEKQKIMYLLHELCQTKHIDINEIINELQNSLLRFDNLELIDQPEPME